jgi:hypothetical protein
MPYVAVRFPMGRRVRKYRNVPHRSEELSMYEYEYSMASLDLA